MVAAGFGGCCVSSSFSFPVTESLNSRMPLPSERPTSGSRLGPRITRAMMRTMMS